jgi:imidazoleglycerol-phosphate dehydratase
MSEESDQPESDRESDEMSPEAKQPPSSSRGQAGASRRVATLARKTKETDIRLRLDLDGTGQYSIATGIPFFDHMLESFARHGLFDLELTAQGDLEVDLHHTVEDVGISLGQAFREALGSAVGIRRFGSCILPMAESKVEVAVDVSNRPYLVYRLTLENDRIGSFDASLTEDFMYAFSQGAGLDLHIEKRYGKSPHHCVEAAFKGVARALRDAVALDPRESGLPTVKGAL